MKLGLSVLFICLCYCMVSCEVQTAPPGTPTPTNSPHYGTAIVGSVNGSTWVVQATDAYKNVVNGKKFIKIRLSDKERSDACFKESEIFTDRRVYIYLPLELGTWNVAGGSVYFTFYRNEQKYLDYAEQGTINITAFTDKFIEGHIEATGNSQNLSGKFSVQLCP